MDIIVIPMINERKRFTLLNRVLSTLLFIFFISTGSTLDKASAEVTLSGSIDMSVQQTEAVQTSQSPGIVGLDMVIRPGAFPVVRDVYRYSPAHMAGVRPGDLILAINGDTTMGKTMWQVDQEISDIPGDAVYFTIRRDGRVTNKELTVASLDDVHPALRALYISSSY